ncbi:MULTISPECIES: DUF6282 family protein [Mesorhizobium]|uniref:DUF6282 family protein n=1 Tax=Mesorhizobium TaxID=68287 RepID=UPI001FE2B71A|nr:MULTISPECIES: DUF6282 family protein [Mesorhizobium]
MNTENTARIEKLLKGAVDLHCHSGPSIMNRRLDHIEAIREADDAGMDAVLVKDHFYCAAPIAKLVNKHIKTNGVTLLSGVPLNNPTGGLNPHAVDHGLRLGARIVWLPTFHSQNNIRHNHEAAPGKEFPPPGLLSLPAEPVLLFKENGDLRDELKQILDLIAAHDAVLSGGHIHISEIWLIFEEAKKRGVKRLLVNHPTYIIEASLEDLRSLAKLGAYLEHSMCMWFGEEVDKIYEPENLRAMIEYGTVDRTIIGSDLGQAHNCTPVEGIRLAIGTLIDLGYSDDDITKMVSTNGKTLLGLDGLK